jgi:hypothetical protein
MLTGVILCDVAQVASDIIILAEGEAKHHDAAYFLSKL